MHGLRLLRCFGYELFEPLLSLRPVSGAQRAPLPSTPVVVPVDPDRTRAADVPASFGLVLTGCLVSAPQGVHPGKSYHSSAGTVVGGALSGWN